MQHKPRFNGILVVAVLMVMVLFIVSMSPLLAASAANHINYSEIYYYFENHQVTSYRLDVGTNKLELWLKEGAVPLPENAVQSEVEGGGLLNNLTSSEEDVLPSNGGTVYVAYKLPYGVDFSTGKIMEFVDEYNAENPDAPMIFDYVAPKNSIPWMEIIFYVVMLGSIGLLFMSMYRGGAGGGIMNVGRAKVKDQQENQRKATFADVAGADEEKAELQEVVEFLKAPGKFNSLGARIPHGVLLVGPPGTGKTLLARACAGEAGVPFYAISGSDFVEMYVGVGASRVRDLFEKAKKTMPSIVFIDEIDAVGRQRGAGLGGGNDEREQTLNQLLVELDGFGANEGVIVIAATNRRDVLDPALLRPGRFDREAITEADIQEATIKVVAGPEKKSRVVSDKERRLTAYHEAGHAIVTYYCKSQDPVHQISIVPRGQAGGYTMSLPKEDRNYRTRSQMFEDIVTLLGGRVAESLMLDDISTGASNDIERATNIARAMVTRYGFSKELGPLVYGTDQQEVFLGRDLNQARNYSEEVASKIDKEMRAIIDKAYSQAKTILEEHTDALHTVAKVLLEYEKVDGETFIKLMETPMLEGEEAAPALSAPAGDPPVLPEGNGGLPTPPDSAAQPDAGEGENREEAKE